MGGLELNSSDSGQGPEGQSCDHSNETMDCKTGSCTTILLINMYNINNLSVWHPAYRLENQGVMVSHS